MNVKKTTESNTVHSQKDQGPNQDGGSSGQGQGGSGGGAYVSPPDFFSYNDPGDDFSAN